MNERIKELEKQCWAPRQYGPAWFNSTKFAELIIQECALVAFKKAGPKTALDVLDHFGVAEREQ